MSNSENEPTLPLVDDLPMGGTSPPPESELMRLRRDNHRLRVCVRALIGSALLTAIGISTLMHMSQRTHDKMVRSLDRTARAYEDMKVDRDHVYAQADCQLRNDLRLGRCLHVTGELTEVIMSRCLLAWTMDRCPVSPTVTPR